MAAASLANCDVTLMASAADSAVGAEAASSVFSAKAVAPSADGSLVIVADFSGWGPSHFSFSRRSRWLCATP